VLQEYVLAPSAVKVEVAPAQIEEGDAFKLKTGNEFTVNVIVCELTQPTASVPVTVYPEDTLGTTSIIEVDSLVLQT
jgi:hypothetical protein